MIIFNGSNERDDFFAVLPTAKLEKLPNAKFDNLFSHQLCLVRLCAVDMYKDRVSVNTEFGVVETDRLNLFPLWDKWLAEMHQQALINGRTHRVMPGDRCLCYTPPEHRVFPATCISVDGIFVWVSPDCCDKGTSLKVLDCWAFPEYQSEHVGFRAFRDAYWHVAERLTRATALIRQPVDTATAVLEFLREMENGAKPVGLEWRDEVLTAKKKRRAPKRK